MVWLSIISRTVEQLTLTNNNGDTYQTLTVGHSGHLAILDRAMGCPEAMLSLGDEDNSNAFIGIREASGVPTAVAGYGQLFTRHIDEDVQSTNLSFVDSSGNLFNVNLVASSADGFSDRAVALDGQGNTFVGIRAPDKRSNIVSTTERNTFFDMNLLLTLELMQQIILRLAIVLVKEFHQEMVMFLLVLI